MFRTTFTNYVATPIDPDTEPDAVIEVLHDHRFLITMSPIVTRHEVRDRDDATGKITYDVWENIDLLPFGWWRHEIKFTVAFENKVDGVISWIEAPLGFNSKADYTVGPARESDRKSDPEQGTMVLHEEIESACSIVFRPFVEWTMVPVRRKMHAQMVEHVRMKAQSDDITDESRGNWI